MLPDEIKVNFTIRPKLLLVSPLAAIAVFGLFYLPWGAKSAPAWVQAVGSVLAIGVAIWVAHNQSAFQVKMVRDREAQLLRLAIALSRHATELIELGALKIDAGAPGVPALRTVHQVMNDWEGILGSISVESLPNPEAAAAWIEVRQSLRGANRSVLSTLNAAAFAQNELVMVRRMHGFAVAAVNRLVASSAGHLPELRVNAEFR